MVWREDRLRAGRATTLWFGPTPHSPGSVAPGAGSARVMTAVELTLGDGRRARMVNTHLDSHSAQARREAATQLVRWIGELPDELPLVVTGDLNATLDDAEVAPLLEWGLSSALPPSAGPTATAFEREPGRRLDHVLVSPHWQVLRAEVVSGAGTASDHYPVVADLRLG